MGRAGGLGGIIMLIVVLALGGGGLVGTDDGGGGSDDPFGSILDQLDGPRTPGVAPGEDGVADAAPDPEKRQVDFVSFVLDDVQGAWKELFRKAGKSYEDSTLELFRGSTNTGCGRGSAATGPFYCPVDRTTYIDLGFFGELSDRFGAPGDFAQAYVIAHELGHHVQTLLGISEQVTRQGRSNELSIRQELQADCFAGVWGHSAYTKKILEDGDLEEGLAAAAAVGDDRIQESAGVRVDKESWTHGSAQQRRTWFRRGFDSGDPDRCDTFSGDI
jgi:predicted metalloprotease